jgi:hypothetical protein
MKLTHLSTVSALALMLAIGGPATAQVTADQPADEPTVGATTTPSPGTGEAGAAGAPTTAQDYGQDRLSLAELDEKVGEIGIEDAELFAGQILIARTDDGDPVIMLMGPEDFQVGETMEFDTEEFTDLRQQLSEAGFEDVRQDHAWQVLQGRLDGHYVLATSGDPSWGFDAAERDTGMTEPRDDLAQQGIGQPQTGDTTAGVDTTPDMTQPQTGDTTAGVDTAPDMTQPQTGDTTAGVDTAPDMTQPQPGDTTAGIDSQPGIDGTAERGLGIAESGVDTQPGVVGPDADQVTRR